VQYIHRGEVSVPIIDPPISKEELLSMVRVGTGVRRHRSLRMAYGVALGSSSRSPVRSRGSESPARHRDVAGSPRSSSPPRFGAESVKSNRSASPSAGALKPIETEEHVKVFMQDLLFYGCRNVRLVVAEGVNRPQHSSSSPNAHSVHMKASNDADHRGSLDDQSQRTKPTMNPIDASQRNRPSSMHDLSSPHDGTASPDTVVIQYEVDPTELWISGPVTDSMLCNLASAMKSVCQAGEHHTGPAAVVTPRIRLKEVSGQRMYLLDLHEYRFSEHQESMMERAITEVMQAVEGLKQVASETL